MAALTIPSIFTAVDKFSAPVMRMTKNMDAFVNKSEAGLARLDRKFSSIEEGAKKVARNSALLGLALAAPLVAAGNEAIKFEDKMADVAKVTDIAVGSQQFAALSDEAKDLGVYLGMLPTEAAGLMENLSSGGVARSELSEIGKLAGRVGVAFGISGEMAGEAFVKTRNALGATNEATAKLMDSINFLGNTMAAKSDEILTFMSGGGAAAAKAANAQGEAVAAMGASLIAMGTSAEESATIMERFTKNVLMDPALRKTFDAAGGGTAGMMAVIEKGSKLAGKAQDEYFQKFGAYGLKLQLLAKNFDSVQTAVNNATNAQLIAGSVQDEFNNRTQTTAFKLQQAKAQFNSLSIELGSALLPAFNKLIERSKPLLDSIINWAKENPGLVATLLKVTAAIAGLSFVVSGLSTVVMAFRGVIWGAKAAVWAYNAVTKAWSVMTGIATAAQYAWNMAMYLNPIGLVIAGIVVLIGVVAAIIGYWNEWGAAVSFFLGPIGLVISLIQSFRRNWDLIVQAFKTQGIIGGLKMIGATILDAILMPLQKVLETASLLPGFLGGDLAADAAKGLEKFRTELGVNTTTDESGNPLPAREAINPRKSEQDAIVSRIESSQSQNVRIVVDDKTGAARVESDNDLIPVSLTPTLQF